MKGVPRFLGLDEILGIHEDQIRRYGGKAGLRDLGLLESAAAMPRAGARGEYFHRDLHDMAAAYVFHIVRNHPFVDGNKRVGAAAGLVFLSLNGVEIRASNSGLVRLILGVADGSMDKAGIAAFFRGHARRRRG